MVDSMARPYEPLVSQQVEEHHVDNGPVTEQFGLTLAAELGHAVGPSNVL